MPVSPKRATGAKRAVAAAEIEAAPDKIGIPSRRAGTSGGHPAPRAPAAFAGSIPPTVLARFAVGDRAFRLILCHDRPSVERAGANRFRIGDHNLAIVEDDPTEIGSGIRRLVERLTKRELQIVHLIAQGRATKDIADRLAISEWTVNTHVKRACLKLGVANRAAMVFHCSATLGDLPSDLLRGNHSAAKVRRSEKV